MIDNGCYHEVIAILWRIIVEILNGRVVMLVFSVLFLKLGGSCLFFGFLICIGIVVRELKFVLSIITIIILNFI